MEPKELKKKYDFFQSDYYEAALLSRIYHINRFRAVQRHLKDIRSSIILDVGCNGGLFPHRLAKEMRNVIGLDISSSFIRHAHRHYGNNVSFILGASEALPFRDNVFDVSTCLEVLEHVSNPQELLKEVHRVLKPSGIIVFLVPNERSLLYRVVWGLWERFFRGRAWRETHLHKFYMQKVVSMFSNFTILEVGLCNLGMLIIIKAMKGNERGLRYA